ncbi:MAG: gamma-glutamyltransferase [Chloroflexota bacterium]
MTSLDGGMVCAAHFLAVEAGLEILRSGGNAFDTAVTVAAVLNVVEPMMSGLGGYGTILTYNARSKKIQFLNASGRIPQNVDSNAFRSPTPNFKENRRSAKAVSTPLNLQAWAELAQLGRLDWSLLLAPAIELAQNGFPIDERLALFTNQQFPYFPEHAKRVYGRRGVPLRAGDRLFQYDLAASFATIASDGINAFYDGEIGRKILETLQKQAGFLSGEDLINAQAEWFDPIMLSYRGHDVYTAAPPATSFPGLIRLGLLNQFPVPDWEHNSPEHLHHLAEITKHAYWCRLNYATDPDIALPPLENLLSEAYLSEVASKIDPNTATRFEPPFPSGKSSQNTTHFVVADREGNLVSATQTIGQAFGSRIMPEGTGIWLNNSLEYCTFEPAGNPMDAHAGRHKLSGDMPTIIAKNGHPWAALGTPGGHTIAQTVPQLVSNMIDFGLAIQDAFDMSRIAFVEPNALYVEKEINQDTVKRLRKMGHNVVISEGGIGFAHGLTIFKRDDDTQLVDGGFDDRGAALVG